MLKEAIEHPDGEAQSPSSRRASPAERGVLSVRRSEDGAKRNAEIGLSASPSIVV
jgi:hypothetical protein